MPIWAPGNSIARVAGMVSRPRGFTLLEVLVVVVIVGVMATLATLALGPRGDRRAISEAELIAALCNATDEAAVLSGRPWGLVLALDGYQQVQFDGRRWQPGQGNEARGHRLPAPLRLEGSGLWPTLGDPARPPLPQLVFLPGGDRQLGSFSLVNPITLERFDLGATSGGRVQAVAVK